MEIRLLNKPKRKKIIAKITDIHHLMELFFPSHHFAPKKREIYPQPPSLQLCSAKSSSFSKERGPKMATRKLITSPTFAPASVSYDPPCLGGATSPLEDHHFSTQRVVEVEGVCKGGAKNDDPKVKNGSIITMLWIFI